MYKIIDYNLIGGFVFPELKMSPDVAGATFMAAGSSAPELATVIIGVFFAEDDIGNHVHSSSAIFLINVRISSDVFVYLR